MDDLDGFDCFGGKRVRLGRSSGSDEYLEDENLDCGQITVWAVENDDSGVVFDISSVFGR